MGNKTNQNYIKKGKQIELFDTRDSFDNYSKQTNFVAQSREEILEWKKKISQYQQIILKNKDNSFLQESIFSDQKDSKVGEINPFTLAGSSINFWRSKKLISKRSAIYFVIDNTQDYQIILYIGETSSADARWKGVHDCKTYINNYKEVLSAHKIKSHLDIRFFLDVPKEARFRRKLEKQLIYLWFPPFNKETRNKWSNTFTNI